MFFHTWTTKEMQIFLKQSGGVKWLESDTSSNTRREVDGRGQKEYSGEPFAPSWEQEGVQHEKILVWKLARPEVPIADVLGRTLQL